MIDICNLKNNFCKFVYDFRVDRFSILGNPFYMKKECERDEVCNKYEEYFYNKLLFRDDVIEILKEMIEVYREYNKLRLFCWCFPRRCHAEIIRDFIYEVVKEKDIDNKFINDINIVNIIDKLRTQ